MAENNDGVDGDFTTTGKSATELDCLRSELGELQSKLEAAQSELNENARVILELKEQLATNARNNAAKLTEINERYGELRTDHARLGQKLLCKEKDFHQYTTQHEDSKLRDHILVQLKKSQFQFQKALGRPFFLKMRRRAETRIKNDAELVASSGFFDTEWYLASNLDIQQDDVDPVWHFVTSGAYDLRDPGPRFSSFKYHKANPDVTDEGIPALLHYLRNGRLENRSVFKVGDLI
ncbi:hypothetical protein [Erythrobacter ani]|uniref:Uncharacterized protein n=1 Tax=Erythrobacter ani TaxID=2827235 RepID=A0ABS6SMP9_9SPHN|nr:hypothetical protein [Erythrobacter ani]MBV7266329.1 hypothetical protein [Erythrobacter ani]